MKKIIALFVIAFSVVAFARDYPNLVVSTNQVEVFSGAPFILNITISNLGLENAYDVKVSVSTETDFILPATQSTAYFNMINSGGSRNLGIKFLTNESAISKIYPVNIVVAYRDSDNINYTSITKIGVKLTSLSEKNKEPDVDVFFVESQPKPYPGGMSNITFDVANVAIEKAYGVIVNASIPVGSIERNSFYIGDLNSNDFQTIDIEVKFQNVTGTYPMNITLQYRDEDNNIFQKMRTFYIDVTPYSYTESKNKINLWEYVIIFVVIIAIILFFLRKSKK